MQADPPRADAPDAAAGDGAWHALGDLVRALAGAPDPSGIADALGLGCAAFDDARAVLYARTDGDRFAALGPGTADRDTLADAVVERCAAEQRTLESDGGRRLTLALHTPSRDVAHVLDARATSRAFTSAERAALEHAACFAALALRALEVAAELDDRRLAVIELNGVKNDLIAMLAHDFNGPLTTIVGLADVLAEDERFDEEGRRLLGLINASAMRLASLASDTLAISRLDDRELSLRFDPVDLAALLRDVVRTLGVARAIDYRAALSPAIVRADAARLRQVFENLIGNAIKFSPRGETVEVLVDAARGGVEVAVRDRGIGIPPGDMPKLFGRFARGSNARERGIGGTGFGLYLARTIVDMHGGRITVESKLDAGSVFRVWIPDVPARQPSRDRRVLLYDGEPADRSFLAHVLRDAGYTVRHALDASELSALLAAERYDIMIVDLERVETAAALRTGMPLETACVALVGAARSDVSSRCRILRKPFLTRELHDVIRAALGAAR